MAVETEEVDEFGMYFASRAQRTWRLIQSYCTNEGVANLSPFPLAVIRSPPPPAPTVMQGTSVYSGSAARKYKARLPNPRKGLTRLYLLEVSGVEPHRSLGNTIVRLSGRGRGN